MHGGPTEDSEGWTGECILRESWAHTTREEEASQVDRAGGLPGPLVFTNVPEYSLVDDLSGEPLPSPLVTLARREEVTEMYRREVWVARSIEDCFRDTGQPPIPVRWVVTNKGDVLRPNVRCRLVAKHLAAKYGGKDMKDLCAAMPPFELVKALLVKAAQRRDRKKTIRKLPPECGKPGVCGLVGFWLYGRRPASHAWQEEYTRQLEKIGFAAGVGSPCCFERKSDGVACVVPGDDFTFEGSRRH